MIFEIVAVGCGPANLSLAALAADLPWSTVAIPTMLCVERKPAFSWHPGQMFPRSRMLSEYVRDLVTPVDPTSQYSFLSYLSQHGRLLDFINTGVTSPTRAEFTDYMAWVARSLRCIDFGSEGVCVSYDRQAATFALDVADANGRHREVHGRNIVLGVGAEPILPDGWERSTSRLLHVSTAIPTIARLAPKRVAVVGGGQSGAELVLHLLREGVDGLHTIDWWFKEPYPRPLDTGHFTREVFSLSYMERRQGLPPDAVEHMTASERGAEHGVGPQTLADLYEAMYLARLSHDHPRVRLVPAVEVTSGRARSGNEVEIAGRSWATHEEVRGVYDAGVACTGFRPRALTTLEPLSDMGVDASELSVNPDSSISWLGPECNRIFVQARASKTRGIGELALATVAERSAAVLKSVAPPRSATRGCERRGTRPSGSSR